MVLYAKKISIPKDTTEASPTTEEIILFDGVIVQVDVDIPSGHKGLAHLQIYDGEVQLYPVVPNEDFNGDMKAISFRDFYRIRHPFRIRLVGWNDDDTFSHDFNVRLNVLTNDQISEKKEINIQDVRRLQQQRPMSLLEWLFGSGVHR